MKLVVLGRPRSVLRNDKFSEADCNEHCDRRLPICRSCSLRHKSASACFYRQQQIDLVIRDESVALGFPHGKRQQDSSYRLVAGPGVAAMGKSRSSSLLSPSPFNPPFDHDIQSSNLHLSIILKHGVSYRFLPSIFSQATDLLETSVEAVSLQCLSLSRRERTISIRARESYSTAIQAAERYLGCLWPGTMLNDVVATILLMALFTIMSSNAAAMRDIWTIHIEGIEALLVRQCSDEVPQGYLSMIDPKVLAFAIRCIHLSHLQRRRPLNSNLCQLHLCSPESLTHLRTRNIINTIAFLNNRQGESVIHQSTITHVLEADEDALDILQHLKTTRPYGIKPPDRLGEPVCHHYLSHDDAQQWNFIRVLRLMLNHEIASLSETIRQSTASEYTLHTSQALSTISALLFDIFASVPCELRGKAADTMTMDADTIHWAHSLIWPLAQVRASPYICKALSPLVEETLHLLCQTTGFPGSYSPQQQQDEGPALQDW